MERKRPRDSLKEEMLTLVAVFSGKWEIRIQAPLGKWRVALRESG